jgi:hypothetical protein
MTGACSTHERDRGEMHAKLYLENVKMKEHFVGLG